MSLRSRVIAVSAAAGFVVLAAGLLLNLPASGVSAQTSPTQAAGAPANVPLARFFGTLTGANGGTVAAGASIVATMGGTVCGNATVGTANSYQIDIQAIPGCTAGGTVTFTVNGQPASPTGTVPAVSGAVNLNLTVVTATPTPAPSAPPPPPPPTRAATAAPPPPTVAPTAVVPARPPVTGLGGLSQQKPSAPVAQKPGAPAYQPGAAAAAPARPALPNTGTGGVLSAGRDQSLSGLLMLAGAISLLGLGAVSFARRK